MPKFIWEKEGHVYVALYVQPGASKSELSGEHNDRLKLRIKAPPVDGKANEAVVKFLAKHLGLSKRQIQIHRGQNNRNKTVRISEQNLELVLAKLC